ncbi:RNA polymerase II subunit A C-terminal domain phosphatase SSU72 [Chionoecetes opilio]|uniref:RNA polymerase II subunit A C-terminal domain phosphatase SSU72 n=1 Tax=Chionoecetes opilio TaxID=41210 RepID=A0A8J4XPE5_CHIOP|nr:RNA polymerase II subunit A C-terminal domain phosphatase SSU72 [Chionoecetes opilio]
MVPQRLWLKKFALIALLLDEEEELNSKRHCFGYTQNGLLHMLDRNRRIKPDPERFQICKDKFDIIVTCEERVYDQVLECLEARIPEENTPVHVINIDIQDNHEEATIGAFMICELAALLSGTEDLDNDIDELLHEFETKCQRNVLHCVQFY